MEDDGACHLDLCEQVEISQDEEYLALSFICSPHILLVHEELIMVVYNIRVAALIGVVDIVSSELAIPEGKNVVPELNDEHGKVQLC